MSDCYSNLLECAFKVRIQTGGLIIVKIPQSIIHHNFSQILSTHKYKKDSGCCALGEE